MRKLVGRVLICGMIAALLWGSEWIFIQAFLNGEPTQQMAWIDSAEAVMQAVHRDLSAISDPNLAKEYLQNSLPKAAVLARRILEAIGFQSIPAVSVNETIGKYILQRLNYTLFFGPIL